MNEPERINLGRFRWDQKTQYLYPQDQNGNDIIDEAKRLTNKQQALIECLYKAAPEKVTSDEIMLYVWGSEHISNENLPELINCTREVLEDSDNTLIGNVPGVGYSLDCETLTGQEEKIHQEMRELAEVLDETTTAEGQAFNGIAWARLGIVAVLAVISVINIKHFVEAYQLKKRFIETRLAVPYPHIEKTEDENKLIVTVEGKECIYEKDVEIITCP
ncbi:winged helix-turn-helix domain-containing protein [Grimontia kaedaensis]|uniref:Winged helix-turn-helix domain-containing protein n=1 Tax=Grimontia kaedaensis TaxID=2872157 RepID=A0ABY4WVQ8_9GAMM|nr:winged helix-turn-helix domain-containing protein [Grimontia kaedaensis]USH01192.1 winged helix-turn-helix domain-containing protein [Grimontia kaedaensis]